jgi:hypothetical protein
MQREREREKYGAPRASSGPGRGAGPRPGPGFVPLGASKVIVAARGRQRCHGMRGYACCHRRHAGSLRYVQSPCPS